ncbi:MAG TPA: hypothetical protein VFR37_01555 [Longimicrobium sp.]|nr:hypothetical protein [Longimicrobium sp.]
MSIRSIYPLVALALWAPALDAQGGLRLAAIEEPGSQGVGILRPRFVGECFVVVPSHVVDPEVDDRIWVTTTAGGREALVNVLDRYSADLGLWLMQRRVDRTACPAWPSASAVNHALERANLHGTQGMLTPWTPHGPGAQVPVRIWGLTRTRFRIAALNGTDLKRGMSGSPVYVSGTLVGIATEIDVDDDGAWYGVALRLDYVEDHLRRFFEPGRPPNDPLIIASLAAPGLGQARTGRPEAAILWAAMATGPSLYALFASEDEQVPRTRRLPDGREEIYHETRSVNPYRELAWVPWITVGIGSFLEARAHAARHYIPPERTDPSTRRRASLRLNPQISPDAGGATRVQVVEIRF